MSNDGLNLWNLYTLVCVSGVMIAIVSLGAVLEHMDKIRAMRNALKDMAHKSIRRAKRRRRKNTHAAAVFTRSLF